MSMLGQHLSEEVKRKISNTQKGRIFSDETKRKISEARMGYRFSEEALKKMSESHKGKRNSEEARRKMSIANKGEKSSQWKGGVTPLYNFVRNLKNSIEWRQKVFIRDNFTCQKCKDKSGGNLCAHHKKRFSVLIKEVMEYMPLIDSKEACLIYSPLWDIDNGITLCKTCHKKEHTSKSTL